MEVKLENTPHKDNSTLFDMVDGPFILISVTAVHLNCQDGL